MSMPSRSLSNSTRWVWLAPAYLGTSQTNYTGHHGIGSCVGWLAAPETVSNGGSAMCSASRLLRTLSLVCSLGVKVAFSMS